MLESEEAIIHKSCLKFKTLVIEHNNDNYHPAFIFDIKVTLQGYSQRMRLQRQLYGMYACLFPQIHASLEQKTSFFLIPLNSFIIIQDKKILTWDRSSY